MNFLEIGLSFIEGLALIASPCILPVLPLILSASVDGGRKRPFGIILGFVLSFTLFALLSRKLVAVFHIDLDIIKYGSLVLLAGFGLILLSEKLSEKFSRLTQRFANMGTTLTANASNGFGSGVLIGLLIGLVWTPCAGPILAAVLVQVIRQESDIGGFFIIASFALGTGIPMLIIALTGRKIMSKLGFLTQYAEAVRKTFGIIILLAVAFIASGVDAQSLFAKSESTTLSSTSSGLHNPLEKPYLAPEFVGLDSWLNSKPLTMQSLKDKVVLIDFWTYSCINCVRTLPYITDWDKKYRDKGLVIIGVHAPEFEFEKNLDNVKAALIKHGIEYPVALDNRLDTWTAFKNRYWPAHYLIDKDGKVVYTHFGEGQYVETENNIRYLLGLDKLSNAEATSKTILSEQTPETYLGMSRSQNFISKNEVAKAGLKSFDFPKFLPLHHWALSGDWNIEGEKIISASKNAGLQLHFNAKKVFLVLGSATGKPISLSVSFNGKPYINQNKGILTIREHSLYSLVSQDASQNGILELTANMPGLEAYAFTFGQ